ncbi:MAG TPA: BrnA antitoxin family protein [Rhizomicrobium sp.]|jgi:uncharacterized protein (DUF4415 family)|nr:BrnA antitoxin family protein [Rhizomicrobium sp.]
MSEKKRGSRRAWTDPDDAPEWMDDQWDRAEIAVGGVVVRPANGTLTKPGRPKSAAPKKSVHLRLSPDVLAYFRETGPGWQTRIDETLRKAAKLGTRKR